MNTKIILGFSAFVVPLSAAPITPDGVNMGTGNTVPTNSYSLAAGTNNLVDLSSFAYGDANEAENYSAAVGAENLVDLYSMGVGFQNEILGLGGGASMAVGQGNGLDNSLYSFAAGMNHVLEYQNHSVALGVSQHLVGYGQSNIAMGNGNLIENIDNCVLIGTSNRTDERYSWVMGNANIGQYMTVTLGKYAAEVPDATLIVGNGANSMARSNGLVVLNNGIVQVPGSLSIAGSPAATQGYLSSERYMTKESSGALCEDDGYFAFGLGAEAEDNAAAMGYNAIAGAENSYALGNDAETAQEGSVALMGGLAAGGDSLATHHGEAFGSNSIAMGGFDAVGSNVGETSYAQGDNSSAIGGVGSVAQGFSSLSSGYWTKAKGAYSVALGSLNAAPSASASSWVETDALFELGNGWAARGSTEPSSTYRSNAIITLKNGLTTLTNKAWKAHVDASGDPLADPVATTDSNGKALVIEGHAQIRGRLILEEAQGDISMGIYD
jgi:hypothetical protein